MPIKSKMHNRCQICASARCYLLRRVIFLMHIEKGPKISNSLIFNYCRKATAKGNLLYNVYNPDQE